MRVLMFCCVACIVALSQSAVSGFGEERQLDSCVEIPEGFYPPPRNPGQPRAIPTFTYLNWPTQADVDSLEGYLAILLPLVASSLGEPADPGVWVIEYDSTLTSYAGLVHPDVNTIRLRNRPTVTPSINMYILAHELGHVWQDVWTIWSAPIREGLADALMSCVMPSVPPYYHVSCEDTFHGSRFTITEKLTNLPEIGSANGNFGNLGLNVPRYALANWVFWRLEKAHGSFLRAFQEELLARVVTDPTFPQRSDDVQAAMRDIVPVVDTVPFDAFWVQHHVLDREPPLGDQIVFRGDAIIGCYSIRREMNGAETGYAGIAVDWSVTDRFGEVIASGTSTTGSRGQIIPFIETPYQGRATVWFRSHFPNGWREMTALLWIPDLQRYDRYHDLGLFGCVEGPEGTVTVQTLDGTLLAETVTDHGQFIFPSITGAGAYRVLWNGREAVVRKDVSPHCVILNEGTTTPVGIADVSAPTIAFSVACAPNPFSSALSIGGSQPLRDVTVYDVSGRLVRTLEAKGATTVIWDGRNDQGQKAPPGVYFYRLSQGGEEVTGKVTKN